MTLQQVRILTQFNKRITSFTHPSINDYLRRMKLYVKYMVSLRCKMMVKEKLKEMGLHYVTVELGDVEIAEDITPEQRHQVKITPS